MAAVLAATCAVLLAPSPARADVGPVRLTTVRTSDPTGLADPRAPGMNPDRRAVDLASCIASGHGGRTFSLAIRNAYPGYVCTISLTTTRAARWRVRVPGSARVAGFSVTPLGPSLASRTVRVAVDVNDAAPQAARLRFVVQVVLTGEGSGAGDEPEVLGEVLVRPTAPPTAGIDEALPGLAPTGTDPRLLLVLSSLSTTLGTVLVAAQREHRGSRERG